MAYSFFNTQQQSAGEAPPGQYPDDEQNPNFGTFQTLPSPDLAKEPTKPFTIEGAPSPAQLLEAAGPDAVLNRPAATTPAPGTPAAVGNPTAPPPVASTGSNLPPYAASFNFWQNNTAPPPAPGGAVYTPGQQQDFYGNLPQYDANGVVLPTWNQNAAGGTADPAIAALNSVLSGDASGMDTSAMKNKYKEQRLQMLKDEQGAGRQAAAGRGMLDSGYQQSQERRQRGTANKDILGAFRDTDIAAAEAGVRNKIAASTALDQALTGNVSRESTRYGDELEGATQQNKQNEFAATHGLDVADSQAAASNDYEQLRQKGAESILNKYKAETATTMEGRAQDIQVAQARSNELLGRLGMAVNLEEKARASSRDKMQFITDIFNTLVQNEQHNAQMGLSWAQLGLNMDEIMSSLIKGLGL